MMLTGSPTSSPNKDSKSMDDIKLSMLVSCTVISVGQGAYGIVVAAKDKETKTPGKELVAIKKIDKAF